MSDPSSSSSAPSAAPDKAGVWEDFIDIFYNPSAVFARRANGSFWIPALVVTVLIGGIFIANSGVLQPLIDAEYHRATAAMLKANPQLTPEQLERGRGFSQTLGKFGVFFGVPIAMALVGVLLWLTGKLVDATITAGQGCVIAAYAYVPKVLESVLVGVQGLMMDPAQLTGRYKLTLSAARFLDPDSTSQVMLALLGRFDLFIIWVTVLLAIGLAVVAKIPRARAAAAAAMVWAIATVAAVIPPLLQSR